MFVYNIHKIIVYTIKIEKKRELTMQYMSEETGRQGENFFFRLIIRLLPIIIIINYHKNSERYIQLTVLYELKMITSIIRMLRNLNYHLSSWSWALRYLINASLQFSYGVTSKIYMLKSSICYHWFELIYATLHLKILCFFLSRLSN